MALTINTNTPNFANLSLINRLLDLATERMSSGRRINRAADDPAGYSVSENIDALSRSTTQAIRNTNDGISFVQTAEGATTTAGDLTKRMREIAVQGSSSTLTSAQRTDLQSELESIITEVERLADNTSFNDINLTDGSTASMSVQVGVDGGSNNQVSITFGSLKTATLGIDTLSVATTTAASAAITRVDTALDSINSYNSNYGATQNRFDSNISNLETYNANLTSSYSNIVDADYAYESAQYTKYQTLQQAALSVMAQSNISRQNILTLLN